MKFFTKLKLDGETISKLAFVFSIFIIIFFAGSATKERNLFPHTFIDRATQELVSLSGRRWYYTESTSTTAVPIYDEQAAYNGLSLVTHIKENDTLAVKVIDMDGSLVHNWDIEWFEIWPEVTHISATDPYIPQARPGTHIHGTLLAENGDLIFNFEHLGLVRLDICGDVVWRLPYRTHHSIYQDEFGHLWVSGQINHEAPLPHLPNYTPPFVEPTILEVSLEGEILTEISVIELLQENNLPGLLYMSTTNNTSTELSGDTLHLNDVETFPSTMTEGVFKAGDIMVSLRNINTLFVFNPNNRQITYLSIGEFVRQHDPDFIDGNTISIFDNNNLAPADSGVQSKIIIQSLPDDEPYIYYTGSEEHPFFTDIMGKHEWLPNGNMIITESRNGRAFEIDSEGTIVWEYINILDNGFVGIVEELHRLSAEFDRPFFEQKSQQCDHTASP